MSLPKVTLDGVEFSLVPSHQCSALEVRCYFSGDKGRCDERLSICADFSTGSVIFLDDTRLLEYLTKRITK